ADHVDMLGYAVEERRVIVDRCGVQRVVVAGQENDRYFVSAERLERSGNHRAVQLVGFEDVAGNDDELRVRFLRQRPYSADGVEPCLVEPGPGLFVQEVRG